MSKWLLLLLLLVLGSSYAESPIDKTSSILSSMKSVEYDATYHHVNKLYGYNHLYNALCFYDFTSQDTLIGTRYQFKSDFGEEVYNGQVPFRKYHHEDFVLYSPKPKLYDAVGTVFLRHSFYVLRKLLPGILQDTTVSVIQKADTTVNEQECYHYTIVFNGRNLGLGGVLEESEERIFRNQTLLISKDNYLPYQFMSHYVENRGFVKLTFNNIRYPAERPDSIWSYDRLTKDHILLTKKEAYGRLFGQINTSIGKTAPDWTLPHLGGDSITLSKLDHELILLEFWFPNCKGAVHSIPAINDIYKTYRELGLQIYGIETETVDLDYLTDYVKTKNITYPVLHSGKQVSNEYGIKAIPTFILIDKQGKIIYSCVGLKGSELISAIEEQLGS